MRLGEIVGGGVRVKLGDWQKEGCSRSERGVKVSDSGLRFQGLEFKVWG